MEQTIENTLRIDPETGAVIINGTMRIEPGWTMEEFVQSDIYKTYVHDGSAERTKVLLLKNVAGQDVSISVISLGSKFIKDIKIEIPHLGAEKAAEADKADFLFLREILYQSLPGDNLKEDHYDEEDQSGDVSYDVPWGYVRIDESSEWFAYLLLKYRERKETNTLRIDPKYGALVINGTMRIEPDWTVEELEQSEAYQKYVYYEGYRGRCLKINNVDGKEIIVNVAFEDTKILFITIKIPHDSPGEAISMQVPDFIAIREIFYQSFTGYKSKIDKEWFLSYEFEWGVIGLNFDSARGGPTEAEVWYRR